MLKSFTNPTLVAQVCRTLLTRLLEDYKHCLPAATVALLTADATHPEFCAACAAQFEAADEIGAPLLHALEAIETLARPENAQLLKAALDHLPPGYEVNRNYHPLHQSAHLWIIAANTPGVTWPPDAECRMQSEECKVNSSPAECRVQHEECKVNGSSTPAPTAPDALRSDAPRSDAPRSDAPPAPPAPPAPDAFARLARLSAVEYDQDRSACVLA